jgi:hypothetical protein
MDEVDREFHQLAARVGRIDDRVERLEPRVDRLEIAVEEIRDTCRLLAEAFTGLRAHMDRRFDEVIEHIDTRVLPLDLAVHEHALTVRHHNLTPGPGRG